MKTCKKCGKRDLSWNKSWYDHSGKWQLVNHKNKEDGWCVNNSLKPKEPKASKKIIQFVLYVVNQILVIV